METIAAGTVKVPAVPAAVQVNCAPAFVVVFAEFPLIVTYSLELAPVQLINKGCARWIVALGLGSLVQLISGGSVTVALNAPMVSPFTLPMVNVPGFRNGGSGELPGLIPPS